jgi:SAM-dependent methyltransferase
MFFLTVFISMFSLIQQIYCEDLSQDKKNEILKSLSQEKYFVYQDIVVNGQTIWQGLGPNCSERYNLIRKILDQYKRPIKVLDLGASNGYFSFKIAQDYDAHCVMVDTTDRLLDLCYLNNTLKGIVYLKHNINLQDLLFLAEHEHFDVVLAFNVLHHLHPCKEIMDTLFLLGDVVIIETPPANDPRVDKKTTIPFIEEYLIEKMNNQSNGQIIGHSLRPMPQQFDYITCMSSDVDLSKEIQYCENVYSKIFYFGTVNTMISSNLFFNIDIYNALGGMYYS